MLTVGSVFAAQGQITEVNPSGIGRAMVASEGRVTVALISAGVLDEFGESGTASGG